MKSGLGRRIVFAALGVGVLVFAIEGGEWGTFDLLTQRGRARRLRAEVDSLERLVDSLTRYKRRLETDAALQERIAREEYGMVRGTKEMLYWVVKPRDTTSREP